MSRAAQQSRQDRSSVPGQIGRTAQAHVQELQVGKSNGVFCTQCEAEGFRRITWLSTGLT
jgi:hypothetical protein